MMTKNIYTIGHSNHSLQGFIQILTSYQITHIVDVRTMPKSRHVPWFNKDKLARSLKKHKIGYTHLPELGGFRKTVKNSTNRAWRNLSFRGFADYMQTIDFFLGLKALNQIVKREKKVAILCAEAVPWRCHRSLIADAETIRHYTIRNIISMISAPIHKLTDFARVNRKKGLFKFLILKTTHVRNIIFGA